MHRDAGECDQRDKQEPVTGLSASEFGVGRAHFAQCCVAQYKVFLCIVELLKQSPHLVHTPKKTQYIRRVIVAIVRDDVVPG